MLLVLPWQGGNNARWEPGGKTEKKPRRRHCGVPEENLSCLLRIYWFI